MALWLFAQIHWSIHDFSLVTLRVLESRIEGWIKLSTLRSSIWLQDFTPCTKEAEHQGSRLPSSEVSRWRSRVANTGHGFRVRVGLRKIAEISMENILREIGVWNSDSLKTKKDQLYYFRIEHLLPFWLIIGLRSDFIWGYVNLDDPLQMD